VARRIRAENPSIAGRDGGSDIHSYVNEKHVPQTMQSNESDWENLESPFLGEVALERSYVGGQ
jgi:hypothetical protein